VLPEPPPWSPLSPPPLGGHVGVMVVEPSLSQRKSCSRESVPANTTRITSQVPVSAHVGKREDGGFAALAATAAGRETTPPKRGRRAPSAARSNFDQENDWPHPQVRVVFGLLIVNPAPCSPSL
jgi:hypothetical protein